MIDMKNKKNNSHYRDCGAITDNLSRFIVIPDLIGYLSRIKKESAEIFGSKLKFCPKMTEEGRCPKMTIQRHSEAQPKMKEKNTVKNLILRFVYTTLRTTIPVFTLTLVLCVGTISESQAINCQYSVSGHNQYGRNTYSIHVTGGNETDAEFTLNKCDSMEIGYSSWSSAKELITSVELDESITSIGDSALVGAKYLTSITMPNVTTIGANAFNDARSLTSVDMSNVTSIGKAAFYNARALTSVDMLKVISIGEWAFYDARALNYAGFDSEKITSWGNEIFYSTLISSCASNGNGCGDCGDNFLKSGVGCVTEDNCGTGYTANGDTKKCVKTLQADNSDVTDNLADSTTTEFSPSDCYNNGKVPYNNKCVDEYPFAKKRYTPAEATQWLNEDNNTVVLTFKK